MAREGAMGAAEMVAVAMVGETAAARAAAGAAEEVPGRLRRCQGRR